MDNIPDDSEFEEALWLAEPRPCDTVYPSAAIFSPPFIILPVIFGGWTELGVVLGSTVLELPVVSGDVMSRDRHVKSAVDEKCNMIGRAEVHLAH